VRKNSDFAHYADFIKKNKRINGVLRRFSRNFSEKNRMIWYNVVGTVQQEAGRGFLLHPG
jgi:hypothetical protein